MDRAFSARQDAGPGADGNEIPNASDSTLIAAVGEPLVELGTQEPVVTMTVDPTPRLARRERFPAWMNADVFVLDLD